MKISSDQVFGGQVDNKILNLTVVNIGRSSTESWGLKKKTPNISISFIHL